jgi:hypothetical protein
MVRVYLSKDFWQIVFAGPLRVKVTAEWLDGTELYYYYPLGDGTVEAGQVIRIEHEVGVLAETS